MLQFLQPCLLTLLDRSPDHGYNLIGGLEEFGLEPDHFDPSLIYRSLRQMEDEGLVDSEWGEESRGPKRRVYQITAEGRDMLDYWTEDLRKTRDEIDRLLGALDTAAGPGTDEN